MTQNPSGVMSPPRQRQTLHLEASFKPLQLTLDMSCHQHSSKMMEEKKKPSDDKRQHPAQAEQEHHHLFSASHIMIQSGSARKGRLDWVCFLILEQNPAEMSCVNHGQMAENKQGKKGARKIEEKGDVSV